MEKAAENIILETRNLEIGYQKKQHKTLIASGINVAVREGELTAVIGINGIGKSTFLRSISGVQPALGGKILIQNKERSEMTAVDLAQKISLVLTEQPLSKNLKVAELVALGRQPYTNWIGTLTSEDRKRVKNALALVNIEELQHKKCYELSDGQLQKVLIARALAQDTPLMILDEPTSHLDMYHKAQVLQLLKELSLTTRKAIIFATHELNLALQLCDKIILMKEKQILQGNPAQLVSSGALNTLFPNDLVVFDAETLSFRIKK